MKFIPIKTRTFRIPQDNIYNLLDDSLPKLQEGDVLFITSKILAIAQGRCIKIGSNISRLRLAEQESEYLIKYRFESRGKLRTLTIKDSTLLPWAGIDESNARGHYILWPRQTNKFLREICMYLKKKHQLKNLAVVATDSRSTPLRRGIVGISTGFFGLEPLIDYREKNDIFGRKLRLTQVNIIDSLTAPAVMLMGEGDEHIPLLLCRGAKFLRFTNRQTHGKLVVPPTDDIYKPLLKPFLAGKKS